MADHQRRTLHSFPFLEHDPRFSGGVEIVHRTSTFEDGSRRFIDLNLRIGERHIGLPTRRVEDIDAIIEALQKAKNVAVEENQKLYDEIRQQQRHDGGDRRDRGHGRHGGGRERRNRYED